MTSSVFLGEDDPPTLNEAYTAGIREGLERAAEVADGCKPQLEGKPYSQWTAADTATLNKCIDIASAIRSALKEQGGGGEW